MATPQLVAMCSWVHFSHRKSGRAIKLKNPKFTTSRRSGPFICPGAVFEDTDSSTSSALGPTKSRSRVTPFESPTAAPSTS